MVYAEQVFIDNFIMDMLLLCSAARASAVHARLSRLTAGAAVGGIYAVACEAVAELSFPPVILLISAVMCVLLTGFSWRLFADVLIKLWAFSLLLGGAVYAAALLFKAELNYGSEGMRIIRYILLGCCAAAVTSEYLLKRGLRPSKSITVEAVFSGRSVVFPAAYDSGASVTDGAGGGVIIANASLFGGIPDLACRRYRRKKFYVRTAGGLTELVGILPDRLILTAAGVRYTARAYILLSEDICLDGCPALAGRGIRAIKATKERRKCSEDSMDL